MNDANIRRYLEVIKRACSLIEQELNASGGTPESLMQTLTGSTPVTNIANIPTPTPPPTNKMVIARKKHVSDLMSIDCWPEAVENYLVASNNRENQINRANAVLDSMLDRSVENLDFLDFGCGDGWIARQAFTRGVNSVTGYDIKESLNWENIDKVKFTANFNDLKQGHYDVIMLYDVLDHCEDAVGVMNQIKGLLKFGKSVVYVRCHPWTSRHATHVYKQGLNKAYVHLFLTWDEITELLAEGEKPMFTRNEKNPLEAYRWWFHEFKTIKERLIKDEPLSQFFLVPSFRELIIQEQKLSPDRIEGFFRDMEVQFVDYILEK